MTRRMLQIKPACGSRCHVAGAWLVVKRLREDHTGIFCLRVGSAAGMFAVTTQNMVEMTLRVPANALLFAILAAVAMHDGRNRGSDPV